MVTRAAAHSTRALGIAKIALYLAAFMGVLDNAVVYLALPAIEHDLHTGIADQQWIVGIYILMQGSFTLAAGTLGDLYGRRRIFLIGLSLFIGGSIACGFAQNTAFMIGGRLIGGLGSSVLFSLSLAMVLELFHDPAKREAGVRGFANVAGIGAVAAPLVGGLCVNLLGWRSVFFINVPFALFSIIVTLALIDESATDPKRRLDVPGQITNVLALLALSFALTEGNAIGWTSPVILAVAAVACLAAAAFIMVERRSADPMLRLSYLGKPEFSASIIVMIFNGMQYYGLFLVASLYLQEVQHESSLWAGLYLFPGMLTFFLVNQNSGFVTKRLGLARTAFTGIVISTAAILVYIGVSLSTPSWIVALILVMWCLGAGLTYTPSNTIGMGSVSDADSGMASGMLGFSTAFGGVLGIGVVGALLASGLTSFLRDALPAAGVPAGVAQTLLVAAHHGGIWSAIAALPPLTIPVAQLDQLANTAFAHGMRFAVLILGIASAIALFGMAWLFRKGTAPAPAGAQRAPATS
jgi:DHA2 family methylenomycin A resistance protein-like MFS transporter